MKTRKEALGHRHRRVRQKVRGTPDRPRMAISRTNKHMYVQFIDDAAQVTLASCSTLGSEAAVNVEGASALGKRAAEAALAKGISRAVVDRGGHRFHGRVKAVVEAAVEAGIRIRSEEGT